MAKNPRLTLNQGPQGDEVLAALFQTVSYPKVFDYDLNVEELNANEMSALHVAIQAEQPRIVKLLLERGADASERSKSRNHLLMATERRNAEVFKILLAHRVSTVVIEDSTTVSILLPIVANFNSKDSLMVADPEQKMTEAAAFSSMMASLLGHASVSSADIVNALHANGFDFEIDADEQLVKMRPELRLLASHLRQLDMTELYELYQEFPAVSNLFKTRYCSRTRIEATKREILQRIGLLCQTQTSGTDDSTEGNSLHLFVKEFSAMHIFEATDAMFWEVVNRRMRDLGLQDFSPLGIDDPRTSSRCLLPT